MKVEIKHEPSPAGPMYPHLAISNTGRVVLFTAPAKGFQLCNMDDGCGQFETSWAVEDFTPLNGSITLSN